MRGSLTRRNFSRCASLGAAAAALGSGCALLPGRRLKVYVFADMEGICGVTCSEQTLPSGPRYREGCERMAEDINACVAGCFDAGATEVVVRDGHGAGKNVDPARIDPRVRLVQGPTPGVRFAGLDGARALILLGYHAKALTPNALLAHTYSSATIQGMWLNGREVGETGVDAAIAAEHGVPVVMVSGCDQVAAEAGEWIPGVVTCVVKASKGPQEAVCLPLGEARGLLRAKAREAVAKRASIPRVATRREATLRWDYLPKGSLRTYDPAFRPVAEPRRVILTGAPVERLFFEKQ